MRRFLPWIALLVLSTGRAATEYKLTEDSLRILPGAPTGRVEKLVLPVSRLYPGATHDAWVYVPAQYDPARPHPVMVFQDGGGYQNREGQWRVPTVLDNLIHRKEVPAMVAVFVNPGVVPAANPNALPRFNRSFEYDSVDDLYARFLAEEVLVEAGKRLNLSTNANDRAIGGASSGGICAFNAAFRRPDLFRRVFCTIGTFVGLRGADELATLVRKVEPLPIRVFLQDGSNDQNIYAGDWWMANQMMQRALEFAGVDHRFVWGDGGHDGKQGGMVFPDAMRWLWRDYPQPLAPNPEGKSKAPVAGWIVAGHGWRAATAEEAASLPAKLQERTLASGYRVESRPGKAGWMVVPSHQDAKSVDITWAPSPVADLCFSPDQTLLYLGLTTGRHAWSYQIGTDGALRHGQPYFNLHLDANGESHLQGMCVDRAGRLYAATGLGIQIFDQAGRVNGILTLPAGFKPGRMGWAGAEANVLVVGERYEGKAVLARPLQVKGVRESDLPHKPEAPRL